MDDAMAEAQRWMWAAGDYSLVAQRLLPISVETVEAVGVQPGQTVLDVGVGDGNTAIEAARRGAVVTGVDLTPEQVERARARAANGGLELDLRVGDAEELDLPDASFDLVVSVMAAIFAPDHVAAAREMVRVCRSGGTVAMTAWAEHGWAVAWKERARELVPVPPGGGPDPDAWGRPDTMRQRLEDAGLRDVEVEEREFHWSFPSTDDAVDFFLAHAGPFIAFRQAAEAAGNGDEVRPAIVAALDESNQAVDGSLRVLAPYVLGRGTKP
jgi:SAM-dependent methyltransferase